MKPRSNKARLHSRRRLQCRSRSKRSQCAVVFTFCSLLVASTSAFFIAKHAEAEPAAARQYPTEHDGQHDFDFQIGKWKSHVSRLLHPLTGSTTWTQYNGISVTHKVWNGHANLVELEADGPAGHLEVLSLRLYNPRTRQWSLNYAHGDDDNLDPPLFGGFKDGSGEVFGQDKTSDGRVISVRHTWSEITANSCRFEQAFSLDGGKTWEVNFIENFTRVQIEAGAAK